MLEEAREAHLRLGEITLVIQSVILLELQPILLQVAGHVLTCEPFDVHQLQNSKCAHCLDFGSGSALRMHVYFYPHKSMLSPRGKQCKPTWLSHNNNLRCKFAATGRALQSYSLDKTHLHDCLWHGSLCCCGGPCHTCMIVLGTAFFKPSCSTASTKRLCSLAVQTRRGRLRARACSKSASSGPAYALGGDGKDKAPKRTDSHF